MPDIAALSTLAKNENEIPGDELAQSGNPYHALGPARVVARQRVDEIGVRARPRPGEGLFDRDGEQALAEPVLRRFAIATGVAVGGPVTAEVVPGRGLVPAPRGQPIRE